MSVFDVVLGFFELCRDVGFGSVARVLTVSMLKADTLRSDR